VKYCKRGHPKTKENQVIDKNGVFKNCRQCARLKANEWHRANRMRSNESSRQTYIKNREKRLVQSRDRVLKVKYGLSREQYEGLFVLQNNKCANLGCLADISIASSHVDHCHTTGKLRGILCKNCNWALGLLKDKTQAIKGLGQYLERS
jgi:hypothetical protein